MEHILEDDGRGKRVPVHLHTLGRQWGQRRVVRRALDGRRQIQVTVYTVIVIVVIVIVIYIVLGSIISSKVLLILEVIILT